MAVRKIEWSWSTIKMILARRVLGSLVLFLSDSFPVAIAMVARGDNSVITAGSHLDEGSWKDNVRDQATL